MRAGSVASSLMLGGRRVQVERPRVRSINSHEITLPSWQAWSVRDPLQQRAMEQMLVGVSTRRYARSLEPLPTPPVSSGWFWGASRNASFVTRPFPCWC